MFILRWFRREFTNVNSKFVKACANGDLSKVKTLHKQGADIHIWYDQALRWAAFRGHLDVVKHLVEHGADVYAVDDAALRWAAEDGYLDVVNFLREVAGPRYKCHECLIKSTCLELCRDFRPGRSNYAHK